MEVESNEVERLKALLFGEGTDRLNETADHLGKLESWIGDAPRLEAAAAHVLVEAIAASARVPGERAVDAAAF